MPHFRLTTAALISLPVAISLANPASAADTASEAETMVMSSTKNGGPYADSTASGGTALRLWANSYASASLSLPSSTAVVIRAAGEQCVGAPNMTLSVDGKTISTVSVPATTWTDYTFKTAIPAGSHTLKIAFTNDKYQPPCDRNLLLDKVTVTSGSTTTTTTPTTTSPTTTTPTTTTPTSATPTTTTTVPSGSATASNPFAANSPWRTALPSSPTLDPKSAAMIAYASRQNAIYSNLVEFGVPIYSATASSPRYTVRCTITSWGTCPFSGYQVPIPTGSKPSSGSDGAMVVVDESTRKVFEFWQAKLSNGQWQTSWGAVNSLDGSGWGGASTGSGASRLAGVIRISEIAQGNIPHALAFQTDNVCTNVFRPPAVKTDGNSARSDCIPEGARIRLDPAVNLDALTLAPAVRTVAKAMQTYGAYVIDRGGASISVSFEVDPAASSNSVGSVYQQAGLRWDYDALPGVPWDRLQVLAP